MPGRAGCERRGENHHAKVHQPHYPPQLREVLVDGVPVGKLGGRALAQQIGYVPQGCEFADSSVFDAVLLGRSPLSSGT